jgi:hypothetical protein
MITWILVIYIYAGAFAKGDSVTVTSVSGFKSMNECQTAGLTTQKLVEDSAKILRFVCLQQSGER